jgi:hypothetical protein
MTLSGNLLFYFERVSISGRFGFRGIHGIEEDSPDRRHRGTDSVWLAGMAGHRGPRFRDEAVSLGKKKKCCEPRIEKEELSHKSPDVKNDVLLFGKEAGTIR